ncbi:HEXXH motif-containing putative peptide modification protein [Streptomyces sp. CA-278952]|uniref:aKG-HExxH-type peptide beta-hydroxylase n=1 Tax=Streptomyces sp. CA-278952 TaxID=2980556 RepID=UPI0023688724|nr:HEXXH motif-containing putative peptide modification protein [Streptomyces sp. CA-278952]WDG27577.1 HEXXH motif-containing putative peptide modification protein [Streptomyces sp. CA-278952]
MQQPMRMPGHWFDELAAGGGSVETVRFLVAGERARRLVLLRELLSRLEERPALLGPADLGAIWRAVERAEARRPDCVEELLLSPQVGSWLAHTLRRLHGTAAGSPLWVDAGHLAAVALVAAVRAGTAAELVVPAREGAVALPTLGLARLPGTPLLGFQPVHARVREGELLLVPAGRGTGATALTVRPLTAPPSALWWPTHRLPVRPGGPEVALDDTDPYRDLGHPIPPQRLTPCELGSWQQLFAAAVALLDPAPRSGGTGPGTLRPEEIGRIVPWPGRLRHGPVAGLSASTADAFGSMVVARPPDGAALAETMVHEFQHSKLGALLHLFAMLDDDREEEHYAPWRPDPRHLPGLLHGAYAFVGVAGFWRDRIGDRAADPLDLAPFRFALRRLQTRAVLRTLATRAALTGPGRRLVAGLTRTVDGWLREPVDGRAVARARAAAAGHRVEWRLRNLRCADEERAGLGAALRTGAPPPPVGQPLLVPASERTHWQDVRGALYLRPDSALDVIVADTGPGVASVAAPDAVPVTVARRVRAATAPVRADVLLVRGEAAAAREAYRERWSEAPGDPHPLAGWLLAHTALHPGHRRLLARPERFAATVAGEGPEVWEHAAHRLAAPRPPA